MKLGSGIITTGSLF